MTSIVKRMIESDESWDSVQLKFDGQTGEENARTAILTGKSLFGSDTVVIEIPYNGYDSSFARNALKIGTDAGIFDRYVEQLKQETGRPGDECRWIACDVMQRISDIGVAIQAIAQETIGYDMDIMNVHDEFDLPAPMLIHVNDQIERSHAQNHTKAIMAAVNEIRDIMRTIVEDGFKVEAYEYDPENDDEEEDDEI